MLCGVSFNFGEGGIGGKIEGELVPGEFVLLQIVDSRLARPLEPRAQVRYREDDTYGFKFYDVSHRSKRMCASFVAVSLPRRLRPQRKLEIWMRVLM